jgi:hypothetical protein
MDLFNNPMVEAAKKAMSPEQIEEYKRIGEYMYKNDVYRVMEVGSKVKQPEKSELIMYATQALNSGGSPNDLSNEELVALIDVYGDKWYERFGFEESEVPKPSIQLVSKEDAYNDMKRQETNFNMSKRKKLMLKNSKK